MCLAHIKHFVIAIITNRHPLVFHWLKNKKRKNLSREAFAKEGKARGLQIAKSFEPHWPQNPRRPTFRPSGFHRSSRVPRGETQHVSIHSKPPTLPSEPRPPHKPLLKQEAAPKEKPCPTHLRAEVNLEGELLR